MGRRGARVADVRAVHAARRSPTASAPRCCFATTTSLPTRWVSFVGSGSCSAPRAGAHRRAAARHHQRDAPPTTSCAARCPYTRPTGASSRRRSIRSSSPCATRSATAWAAALAATNDTHLLGGTGPIFPAEALRHLTKSNQPTRTSIVAKSRRRQTTAICHSEHRFRPISPLAGLQLKRRQLQRADADAHQAHRREVGRRRQPSHLSAEPLREHHLQLLLRAIEPRSACGGSDPLARPLQPADAHGRVRRPRISIGAAIAAQGGVGNLPPRGPSSASNAARVRHGVGEFSVRRQQEQPL